MKSVRVYCMVCTDHACYLRIGEQWPKLVLCKACTTSLEALQKEKVIDPTDIIIWAAKRARRGEGIRLSRIRMSRENKKEKQATIEEANNEGETLS